MTRTVSSDPVVRGALSARRTVPADIARPEYVGRARPDEGRFGDVYSPADVERIRHAGSIAANALAAVSEIIAPGVTTDEIDAVGHEFLLDHGAYPSCLDYRGFPKSVCTSVNEVICHGIPDSSVLLEGDIVNVDITAYVDEMHGDTNYTFYVGEVEETSRLLVERTHEAMMRGIKAVKPGREVNVIGRVIEKYANRFGYGVVRDYTGHGVGRDFHSGLIIPHYDAAPAHNEVMEPGMVFTIEPMLNLGTPEWQSWDDGWTILTKDLARSAQFEHTVVVTEDGADILTLPDPHTAIAGGPARR